MTKIIDLKELVAGTYYRPGPGADLTKPLTEVPEGTDYDAATMIHQIFSYKSTLISILKSPQGKEGMDYEDMQVCVDVIKHIKQYADGDHMPIDDDLYSKILQKVNGTKWMVASEEAVQFVHDIRHPESIAKEKLDKIAAESANNGEQLDRAIAATAPTPFVRSKKDRKSNGHYARV